MSTDMRDLKNTGSRGVDLNVTRYNGPTGLCYQIGGITEEGNYGYVQLSTGDIRKLYNRYCKKNKKCK